MKVISPAFHLQALPLKSGSMLKLDINDKIARDLEIKAESRKMAPSMGPVTP